MLAPVVYHTVPVAYGFVYFKTADSYMSADDVEKDESKQESTASIGHGGECNAFLGRQVTTKNDDSPGGSDIARSHKTGEITCYGDEGENVRGLDGIKTEPDTEKQREFQMASWIAELALVRRMSLTMTSRTSRATTWRARSWPRTRPR